jgi:hypothetical protein
MSFMSRLRGNLGQDIFCARIVVTLHIRRLELTWLSYAPFVYLMSF